MKREYTADQIKLLQLLSKEFPTIPKVGAEIVNLNAISNLPKGTEHFMSDLHGESEAFEHILNNCSGVVREKVRDIFGKEMSEEEMLALLASDGMLVKRPLLVTDSGQVIPGFKAETWSAALGK